MGTFWFFLLNVLITKQNVKYVVLVCKDFFPFWATGFACYFFRFAMLSTSIRPVRNENDVCRSFAAGSSSSRSSCSGGSGPSLRLWLTALFQSGRSRHLKPADIHLRVFLQEFLWSLPFVFQAAVGRVKEVSAALLELRTTRVHCGKEEKHPCDAAFSERAEHVSRACRDLSEQVTEAAIRDVALHRFIFNVFYVLSLCPLQTALSSPSILMFYT